MRECVVCLEPLSDIGARPLACGHAFHADCVRRWLQVSPTCPVCRGAAVTERLETQRQHIDALMQRARDPALFKVRTSRAGGLLRVTADGALASSPAADDSGYRSAHHYALKAEEVMARMSVERKLGDVEDWLEAAASMLVHLHMAGDPRAQHAAGESRINMYETAGIARRLAQWAVPPPPLARGRYRPSFWRWLLCF